jgi:iron-sulfur cluster repair protein YtfE (RIC family)
MSEPLDAILCFHNAFRRDIIQIDASVYKKARIGEDLASTLDRFHIMGEILEYHARGEEEAVFPAVEEVAPLIAQPYIKDHRELDDMVSGLESIRLTPDPLTAARATAVLESHLKIHLYKEDAYLYPTLRNRTTAEKQASIVGVMAQQIPPNKNPTIIRWLFLLLNIDERVTVTQLWMSMMPTQVFAGAKSLIKETLAGEWLDLVKRIPELESTT